MSKFGWWYVDNNKIRLRWWQKSLVVVNIILVGVIIWLIWFNTLGKNSVENCWDKYSTEQQAIEMCENG